VFRSGFAPPGHGHGLHHDKRARNTSRINPQSPASGLNRRVQYSSRRRRSLQVYHEFDQGPGLDRYRDLEGTAEGFPRAAVDEGHGACTFDQDLAVVCAYVCMCVCMYVCMHVSMYV
jgi:hypothetical protein